MYKRGCDRLLIMHDDVFYWQCRFIFDQTLKYKKRMQLIVNSAAERSENVSVEHGIVSSGVGGGGWWEKIIRKKLRQFFFSF